MNLCVFANWVSLVETGPPGHRLQLRPYQHTTVALVQYARRYPVPFTGREKYTESVEPLATWSPLAKPKASNIGLSEVV